MYSFKVQISCDDEGKYIATIPALKYCMSEWDTVEEVLENIQEAMEWTIEVMQEEGIPIPQEKTFLETTLTYRSLRSHDSFAIAS